MQMWLLGAEVEDTCEDCTDRLIEVERHFMPMERFLDDVFGKGKWVRDDIEDVWLAVDPEGRGGYVVVQPDKALTCRRITKREFN
jgi:hypothetical protein